MTEPGGSAGTQAPAEDAASTIGSLGDLADAVPHLVWVADADGVVLAYNRRIELYASARRRDGDGWRWELLVHADDLAATATAWAAADATGLYEHEHRLRMADGTYRWHLSRGRRVTDPATGAVRWYGTATDIDEGRRTEDLLRQTQRALAIAMRAGRMGWWTRDLRTGVVTWSPELEELFGLEVGAFHGTEDTFLAFVHPDDRGAVTDAVGEAVASGGDYVVPFRFRHVDGSWRWMEGRGRASYEDGRPAMLHGIGIDITERVAAERSVRASEERLRLAAAASGLGLYEVDLTLDGIYWSPELRSMWDWPEEAPAVPLDEVPIHPDDRVETLDRLAAAMTPGGDGVFVHEFRVTRRDGGARWVGVHGQTFFAPAVAADAAPTAVRMVGIVQDITERRRLAEIREVFIGMLSHELRTPVTAIYGGAQLLRREVLRDASREEIVGDIVAESERLERLVENLLVLAQAEREVVDAGHDPVLVRPAIDGVVADERRQRPDARIAIDVQPGLPPARWDDASMGLVLRNLISNALKYAGDAGAVTVSARSVDDQVEITVADAGPGLPPGDPERLFQLFYRSDDARRRASGAGIGLFVVRALVESAGGVVWAADVPSGGAIFGLRVPAYVEAVDEVDE